MKKTSSTRVFVFFLLIVFSSVAIAQMAKKGWKKTVTLPSGEVILDISGEWDAQIENYGPWSRFGKYTNIIKITLEGNSFVGIRMKLDQWHSPGSESMRGELDKDGIKKVQLMSGLGPLDAKGQISEDGNKIIIDDGEKARSILIRK
jgi:hypothetical protein